MSEPITNLTDAVAALGALPMPVGPEPQADDGRAKAPWGRDEDGKPFLPMGARWTDVPELVDREVAKIQGRVDGATSGHWYDASVTETWRPLGTVRTNVDGYQRGVGQFIARPGDMDLVLHAHDDLSWCLGMIAKFRALVAELEAERHTTNEALDDAVQALREQGERIAELEESPLAWTDKLDSKSLDNFLICMAQATEYEPMNGAVDEIHQLIRSFREQVESGPSVDESADGLTQVFAPVAALREDAEAEAVRRSVDAQFPVVAAFLAEERVATEDPHDSPLHQTHRIGRDLPEMGGAPC